MKHKKQILNRRCDMCGQFLKRGLINVMNHYQKHIDNTWIKINKKIFDQTIKDVAQ